MPDGPVNPAFKAVDSIAPSPVTVRGLSKSFQRAGGEVVNALRDIDLVVEHNEIVVLLGPSGCGKTTLLRCIAGLEDPNAGTIQIGSTTVFDGRGRAVPPNKRDVNMMFQSYALWPHMTLEANVAYPLRINGTKRKPARLRANEYLDLVGLGGLGNQYAANISGGQQQRVALARTLVSESAVVLFDEPLSNVDAKVRAQLRNELLRIHSELKFAAVYVTHDQMEAMALGTRLAVMDNGVIAQLGSPVEIYDRPGTEYVAQFIGAANILDAKVAEVRQDTNEIVVACPLGEVVVNALDDAEATVRLHGDLRLMIRPEECLITNSTGLSLGTNTWRAIVESVVFGGAQTEYTCRIGEERVIIWRSDKAPFPPGTEAVVSFPKGSLRLVRS